jgi:S1-C subfamily serine protease
MRRLNIRAVLTPAVLALATMASARVRAEDGIPAGLHDRVIRSTVWVSSGRGHGSGCLIEGNTGTVLTAYHVVKENERVAVAFPAYRDGQLITDSQYYRDNWNRICITGRVIRRWPDRDLALIQLDRVPAGVEGLRLGGSARVGERTHRVGTPAAGAVAWTVTVGPVTSVRRERWSYPDGQAIDTDRLHVDATPRYGDSGSPVVNDRGELVGIHVCGGGGIRSGAIDGGVILELLHPVERPGKNGKSP